jgi:hypothetical protein
MLELEQQINAALQSRLPSGIGRKKHCLAIDLHLIPYYCSTAEVLAHKK